MIPLKQMLEPVKREDFILAISRGSISNLAQAPESHFGKVLEQLKKFAVGKYFWFIADLVRGDFHQVGGMPEEITSISKEIYLSSGPEILFQRAHPEDIQSLFAFTNQWIGLLMGLPIEKRHELHSSFFIRLKNKAGLYKWVMIQYADHIYDEQGNILFALTFVTDISHIKNEGPALMSILDTSNETCQHFFCSNSQQLEPGKIPLPKMSKRELEVLGRIAIGLSSKQIAGELNLSVKTIDNHRQNMLHKANAKSTGQLIKFAIEAGFI